MSDWDSRKCLHLYRVLSKSVHEYAFVEKSLNVYPFEMQHDGQSWNIKKFRGLTLKTEFRSHWFKNTVLIECKMYNWPPFWDMKQLKLATEIDFHLCMCYMRTVFLHFVSVSLDHLNDLETWRMRSINEFGWSINISNKLVHK